jgi:hypothetical protein
MLTFLLRLLKIKRSTPERSQNEPSQSDVASILGVVEERRASGDAGEIPVSLEQPQPARMSHDKPEISMQLPIREPASGERLFNLDSREREILIRRYGSAPPPLRELGEQFGVTRERIRQQQIKGRTKVVDSVVFSALQNDVIQLLKNKEIVSIDTVMDSSSLLSYDADFQRLLATLLLEELAENFIEITPGVLAYEEEGNESTGRLISAAVEIGYVPRHSSVFLQKLSIADPELHALWARRIDSVSSILSIASDSASGGRRRLLSAHSGAELVLLKAGEPLHFEDLTEKLNMLRQEIDMHPLASSSVHNAVIQRKDIFAYADTGTFGLLAWGGGAPYIRTSIREVFEEAQSPLTLGEVISAIERVRPNKASSVRMYLDMHTDFYRGRSGKFGLRQWLPKRPTLSTSRDLVEDTKSAERVGRQ